MPSKESIPANILGWPQLPPELAPLVAARSCRSPVNKNQHKHRKIWSRWSFGFHWEGEDFCIMIQCHCFHILNLHSICIPFSSPISLCFSICCHSVLQFYNRRPKKDMWPAWHLAFNDAPAMEAAQMFQDARHGISLRQFWSHDPRDLVNVGSPALSQGASATRIWSYFDFVFAKHKTWELWLNMFELMNQYNVLTRWKPLCWQNQFLQAHPRQSPSLLHTWSNAKW